jgi:hypothetical protein
MPGDADIGRGERLALHDQTLAELAAPSERRALLGLTDDTELNLVLGHFERDPFAQTA